MNRNKMKDGHNLVEHRGNSKDWLVPLKAFYYDPFERKRRNQCTGDRWVPQRTGGQGPSFSSPVFLTP